MLQTIRAPPVYAGNTCIDDRTLVTMTKQSKNWRLKIWKICILMAPLTMSLNL